MDKKILKLHLDNGLTNREIGEKLGYSKSNVNYWIQKHELTHNQSFYKLESFNFNKIDSKEKAYALGFILADADISNSCVDLQVAIKDKEVLDFISSVINSRIKINNKLVKEKRIFPNARTSKKIKDIHKYLGGEKKDQRNYPRVPKQFEIYLLRGLFDADGCITWGRRKDRNRLWQKISFTSSLSILSGVQQYILKHMDISTAVRPKSKENCYILEFSNKKDVLKFLDILYSDNDFIVLKRKYSKYQALRLELGEFGEA